MFRSYSKYERQQQEVSTQYTTNKYTDWHKKYISKDLYDIMPKNTYTTTNYSLQQRRQSDYSKPILQTIENQKENRCPFDIQNHVHRLQIRLNKKI